MVTKQTAQQKRVHPALPVCGENFERERESVCVRERERERERERRDR